MTGIGLLRPLVIVTRARSYSLPNSLHRVTHDDSRYPDPAEIWRKWQACLAEAEARKQEILAMPKAPA
jgi:hypothetical protein